MSFLFSPQVIAAKPLGFTSDSSVHENVLRRPLLQSNPDVETWSFELNLEQLCFSWVSSISWVTWTFLTDYLQSEVRPRSFFFSSPHFCLFFLPESCCRLQQSPTVIRVQEPLSCRFFSVAMGVFFFLPTHLTQKFWAFIISEDGEPTTTLTRVVKKK